MVGSIPAGFPTRSRSIVASETPLWRKQWRHEREHVAVAAAAERAPLALLADRSCDRSSWRSSPMGDEPARQAEPVLVGLGPTSREESEM